MKISINKEEMTVSGPVTLAQLLTQRGVTGPGIAVAIDGKVVRRADWAATPLSDGMEITVISAVCGG
ncbi:MAG: sulfur carrier protein ThiS [Muribaculaceae bacterium]|jgi:sulfur carrier protein